MESQYSYSDAPTRPSYDMLRVLHSPPMGSNYRFDGSLPRNPPPPTSSYTYPAPGSQLPPLTSREGSNGSYGPMPTGRQQTSPLAQSMPFPPHYTSQPQYSGGMTQFANGTPPLPQYNATYGFQGSPMAYQGEYSPTSPMPDYRGTAAPAHAPSLQGGIAPHGYPAHAGMDPNYQSRETHVVGAQGRRGILPSDEGRPPAIGPDATRKSTVVPQKNEEGKYPCEHCNKTYLHAKHLKRHMLRHTGDRPYACVLCNDTFSRSDILKRHFQKCSIRRGNPTGATHLSHPSAYNKKRPVQRKPSGPQVTPGGTRPSSSDSSSGHSAPQSAGDLSFDHHPGLSEMSMSSANGANGIPQPHGALAPAYGTSTLHSSPATSPHTSRPPASFYSQGVFPSNGAYMDSHWPKD